MFRADSALRPRLLDRGLGWMSIPVAEWAFPAMIRAIIGRPLACSLRAA